MAPLEARRGRRRSSPEPRDGREPPPRVWPAEPVRPQPQVGNKSVFHLRAPVWSTSLWQPQNPARHPGSGHSGGRCRRPVAGRAGARTLASRAREPRRPPASGAGSASRHGAHAGRPRVQSARATAATVTTYQAPHPEKPTAWMTVRTNWAPKMKKNAMKLKELSALERRGKAREGGPASLPSPGTGPRGTARAAAHCPPRTRCAHGALPHLRTPPQLARRLPVSGTRASPEDGAP